MHIRRRAPGERHCSRPARRWRVRRHGRRQLPVLLGHLRQPLLPAMLSSIAVWALPRVQLPQQAQHLTLLVMLLASKHSRAGKLRHLRRSRRGLACRAPPSRTQPTRNSCRAGPAKDRRTQRRKQAASREGLRSAAIACATLHGPRANVHGMRCTTRRRRGMMQLPPLAQQTRQLLHQVAVMRVPIASCTAGSACAARRKPSRGSGSQTRRQWPTALSAAPAQPCSAQAQWPQRGLARLPALQALLRCGQAATLRAPAAARQAALVTATAIQQ